MSNKNEPASNVSNKTSKDTERESKVTTPKKEDAKQTVKAPETNKEITQGTKGEQKAPSMPDPEFKSIAREDKSLKLDLQDNTKESEQFHNKPAAEQADIRTKTDNDLQKNEVVKENEVPERNTENQKIITQEIDGKEQVFGVQDKETFDAAEAQQKTAVSYENAVADHKPSPIEKTIGKLQAMEPEETAVDENDKEAKMDDKIVGFIKKKGTGDYIKINDFLKSLYPVKKSNEPQAWDNQGESKRLRVLLDNMQSHGMIDIRNNTHAQLGTTFYVGNEQFAKNKTLNNVDIYAK